MANTKRANIAELAQTSSKAVTPCLLYDTPKAAANSAPATPIIKADAKPGGKAPVVLSR
ncbi:hypothetical protein KF715C_pA4650 (plasmid) [Pseudomonas putida]|uniref:Uncharacterized protein n=1 Tax=Pseudomonas putida TaxID=303 RepID=A0A1L7NNB1_PSEPU|nr:hypothetical protein KF715C_pA4650 [Pseudomonas putida]